MTTTERDRHQAPLSYLDGPVAAGLALGVAGLFMFNLVCGPFAIALGIAGLRRSTRGSVRIAATIAAVLGVSDLVVLAVLVVSKVGGGGFSWGAGG